MVGNSKQKWEVGQTVKVGFLTLVVKAAIPTPGNYAPDYYLLTNSAGDKIYEFVPHNGCRRIEIDEARELLIAARNIANQFAARATEHAALASAVTALFAEVA